MKRIDKFTKEEIKQAFRESKSLDAVARKLGYKDNSGGTHSALKKYVEENNIDITMHVLKVVCYERLAPCKEKRN